MKHFPLAVLLLSTAALIPHASAIVTLGLTNQNLGLTGIGGNSSGEGQSLTSFGTCTYDGTTTTCTLSGPYTGFGSGGTYSFVVSYPGNGPFPLNTVSRSAGSDLIFYQATGPSTFMITLADNNGTTTNFYSFANFSLFYTNGTTCTNIQQQNCSVGQVGLTPGATLTGKVTGSFDPTPMISPLGVISAGNYGGFPDIAPGTWIEMYGVNLATTRGQTWADSDFKGNAAPTSLGGTTVTVGGIPAFVDYVSPGQVNVQVPSGVQSGQQSIVVTTAGGSSAPYTIQVNPVEPGILAPPAFRIGGNQYAGALLANTLTFILPNQVNGVRTAKAKVGDILTFYGIGFGPVTPDLPAGQIETQTNTLQKNLQVTFAGVPATVTYDGLTPSFVGLYQFNVKVPQVAASDLVPVAFSLDGMPPLQTLFIPVQ